MNKIKLAIVIATLAAAPASQASELFAMVCKSRVPNSEGGYTLTLKSAVSRYTASLSEGRIYGTVDIGTFTKLKLVTSTRPGEGQKYIGRDFSLRLPVVAPVDGKRVAFLKAQSKGQVIEEELLCASAR